MSMTVLEYNDIGDLESLRPAWSELLEVTPEATFFQSLDWLQAYWQHFGQGQKLRVIAVMERGSCVGILPLVVRKENTRVGTMRLLTYPLDDWGSFYGPIAQHPARVNLAAWSHVLNTRRDWDVIEPRWLTQSGCTELARHFSQLGISGHVTNTDSSPIVSLDGTWEDFLASKTSKWRNNLKRWERNLRKLGELTHVRHRPLAGDSETETRWDLFDECLQVARRSWQHNSPDGTTLSDESILPFLTDVHGRASQAGCLDLNLLRLDGRPIAFAYNYVLNGKLCGLRVGFDPEHGRSGAGNLLYARVIEDSFLRGDKWYDLGAGSLEAKRHIATSTRESYRLTYSSRLSLRGQLISWKRKSDACNLPGLIAPDLASTVA